MISMCVYLNKNLLIISIKFSIKHLTVLKTVAYYQQIICTIFSFGCFTVILTKQSTMKSHRGNKHQRPQKHTTFYKKWTLLESSPCCISFKSLKASIAYENQQERRLL